MSSLGEIGKHDRLKKSVPNRVAGSSPAASKIRVEKICYNTIFLF